MKVSPIFRAVDIVRRLTSPRTRLPALDAKYEIIPMTEEGQAWDTDYRVRTFGADELERHRVTSNWSGKIRFVRSGKAVSCSRGIYAMDSSGNVYVIEKPKLRVLHHSTLCKEPAGAGQISAENGWLTLLNENTGHFGNNQKPGTVYMVARELETQGVDISRATLEVSYGRARSPRSRE